MGDNNRFTVFANFIAANFHPCRVADVAGGSGCLSLELAKRGFECVIIDPRSKRKREARQSGLQPRRLRKQFTADMAVDFDLIVGLHPDEATEEICKAAHVCPVVLVPCCNHWRPGAGEAVDLARQYFRKHRIPFWETMLPMGGRNVVLVTKGVTC